MFFPDKPAAFAEARRVLTPEGTLLLSTWGAIDTHDFQAALVAGLERAFPEDPPTFMVSVPHGYADVDVVVTDLDAGGLDCVAVESVTLEGRAASAADVAAGYCTGTPLRPAIEARGDLATTTAVVAREMEARLGAGAVTGRMTAHVIEATPALLTCRTRRNRGGARPRIECRSLDWLVGVIGGVAPWSQCGSLPSSC